MTDEVKRRVRGKGKKPALVAVSIRIDKDVLEFYKTHYKANVQGAMREVLTNYFKDADRVNFDKE